MAKEKLPTREDYIAANSFLSYLRAHANRLTQQEYRTLRVQAIHGDIYGAQKGLSKLLELRGWR